MFIDFKAYIDFLKEHNLTGNQFILLYGLAIDQTGKRDSRGKITYKNIPPGVGRPVAFVSKYLAEAQFLPISTFKELERRGFIINRNDKTGQQFIVNVEVTQAFIDLLFTTTSNFESFWELYPGFAKTQSGSIMALKCVSEEETQALYNRKVLTLAEHSRMMNALRWAINQREIVKVKITNFLESRMWRDIEKLMDQEESNNDWGGTNI